MSRSQENPEPLKPGDRTAPFHAWFIRFAPYENPKLAICVFVENGESGSRVAGPIAKDILTRGLSLLAE